MQPLQAPEDVARAIVGLVEHPRRERHLPRAIMLLYAAHWLMPRSIERVIRVRCAHGQAHAAYR